MTDTTRPVLVVVDPSGGGGATARELDARYGLSYTVMAYSRVDEALLALRDLADRGVEVALVLADRACGGAAVLDAARPLHPHARRGLLLGWNESRSHREEVAVAFAQRQAECFVTRPVAVPDERFHRTITELLDEWWRIHGTSFAAVHIIAADRTVRVAEICDALQRHDFPYVFHRRDSERAAALLVGVDAPQDAHVVVLHDGRTLVNPSNVELANALGARTRPGPGVYDLVVVGGGPAGLSAAVYAESEGLRTALIEPSAMGGQAGTSSMIRNYLGFPRGISGAELAARAFEQAILFGTEMIYGAAAVGLHAGGDIRIIELSDGTQIPGRSVIVATGVSYRTLDVAALDPFTGRGVFYGAAMSEAPSLVGQDVFVVGGGNSAGQAALYLAKFARRVIMLVRGHALTHSMSDYLITEIEATANIDIRYRSEVVGGRGRGRLENLDIRDRDSGDVASEPAAGLFILIGAAPFTEWLPAEIARDEWGYVVTGPTDTQPNRLAFESTMPGVFAAGDVRRGSIKRVASATGEGAVCVRLVHDYLASRARPHPIADTSRPG